MRPMSQRVRRVLFLAAFLLLSGVAGLLVDARPAGAYTSYLTSAENQYRNIIGTKLDSCQFCHPSGGYSLDPYAQAYKDAGHSFTAIEQLDSDKDGFTNIVEITALTWPGDASDHPVAAATNTPTSIPTTPTATSPGPAATSTPTATSAPATATPTSTQIAATAPAPAGATPTPYPLPTPFNKFAFVGEVSDFPEDAGHEGNWEVDGRTVRVSQITWLEQPGLLGVHSQVWVLGMRAAGGAVDATYIRILTKGEEEEVRPMPTATATRAVAATADASTY